MKAAKGGHDHVAPGHCSRRERGKKSRIASERPHSPSQGERGTLPSASYSSREHAAHTPSLPPRLLRPRLLTHAAENAPSQHIRSAQILHAIVTTSSLCLFRMSVCELLTCVRMYFPPLSGPQRRTLKMCCRSVEVFLVESCTRFFCYPTAGRSCVCFAHVVCILVKTVAQ